MSESIQSEEAAQRLRALRDAISSSREDLSNMPMLVRPMIKRGFAKRTGRSFDEWEVLAAGLLGRVQRGALTRSNLLAGHGDLMVDLERLAETYRTAPERAAKFMRDEDTLRIVRERAAARDQAVRAVIELLRALPA